ncbi:MAG: secretin N-terminal domain-containing protein [Burkholderiales bacterium]
MKRAISNSRWTTHALLVAVIGALAACAATLHPAYHKGQELLAESQWERGIEQLQIAAKEDERNYQYRSAVIDARGRAVNDLLRQGIAMRDAARTTEAEALFQRVLRIQPEEPRALAAVAQIGEERRRQALLTQAEAALDKGDLGLAEQVVHNVMLEAPRHARAIALMRRIEEKKPRPSSAAGETSAALKKPITLDFRDASLRVIFDVIARETGISFVLDRDIPAAARASIFVRNKPIDEALESLIVTNALAKKVMSDTNILIYPNTPQKARDYQDLVIRNFYLASADPKQMLTLIRTILKTANIFIDEKRNVLVMRDTPEAIRLAEKLIAAHDQVEPEVMLEVEILEVGRTRANELGPRFPDQVSFGVVNPITLQALNNLNSSGVNVSGLQSIVALNLRNLFNNVNLLANPRIRVRNREKAKIHVGDRVPVISSTTSATTTFTTQAVNYLEVGIKLEVEPQIMDDEVMIKVGLEVSSLGQQVAVQGSIAYQVGTRNATTTLTLKDGETQILAGLITDNEREAVNRLPGLGDVPVLGRLFSSNKSDTEKTEIILSITPRVLRRFERPSAELAEYWSGPESNLRTAVGTTPAPGAPGTPVKPGAGGFFPGGFQGGGGQGGKPAAVAPAGAVTGTATQAGPVAPAAPGPTPTPVPGAAAIQSAPVPQGAPASPFSAPPIFFQPPPGAGQ